jgi:uncharacterized membrane protein
MDATPANVEMVVMIIAVILAALPQIAALLGKPKWVERFKAINKSFDAITGNYGKAKNKDE